jgi:hypothetical protein
MSAIVGITANRFGEFCRRSGRADSTVTRGASAIVFRLDLTIYRRYNAPTQRQAVSIANVGTGHPDRLFWAEMGTNLDECRSNAVEL